jgi:ABC-type sulfate/molybdate transport systems ATPase subunit
VLLLDEPTSALDTDARDAVESTLRSLHRRTSISTVIVTHDLEQAKRLAEWVVRIDHGRVVEQGEAVAVL